jgi:hypothetical protein
LDIHNSSRGIDTRATENQFPLEKADGSEWHGLRRHEPRRGHYCTTEVALNSKLYIAEQLTVSFAARANRSDGCSNDDMVEKIT